MSFRIVDILRKDNDKMENRAILDEEKTPKIVENRPFLEEIGRSNPDYNRGFFEKNVEFKPFSNQMWNFYTKSNFPSYFNFPVQKGFLPFLQLKNKWTNHHPLISIYYQNNHKKIGGQIRFTIHQIDELEKQFHSQKYLSPSERKKLAEFLKLSDRQVKTWFQNRRAKWRRNNTFLDNKQIINNNK